MEDKKSELTLKWGSLKAFEFHSEKAKALLEEYVSIGASMSAAMQRDTPRQTEIILALIDECDDPEGIYLDWDGKYVTKDEAKLYVLNYGKKAAAQ